MATSCHIINRPLLVFYLSFLAGTNALVLPRSFVRPSSTHLSSSTEKNAQTASSSPLPLLGGVPQFEKWRSLLSPSSSTSTSPLKIAPFENGRLRGLEYTASSPPGSGGSDGAAEEIARIPKSVVLRTEYEGGEWDAKLAVMLLKECRLGEKSAMSGYISLLTRGQDFTTIECPYPTAPDALRHWTSDEMSLLKSTPKGIRLLEIQEKQSRDWNAKFDSLSSKDKPTREQFMWAMEAVHSRAFFGDFGTENLLSSFGGVGVSALATIAGFVVLTDNSMENQDIITIGCGVIALLPVLFKSFFGTEGNDDVVLLPVIDSANHDETVNSEIEFDPLKGDFILNIGDSCLKKDVDGRSQVFISYGKKGDGELLLNYGFLKGLVGGGESGNLDGRRELAEEFVKRTS